MQLHRNVLKPDTINRVLKEIDNGTKKNLWRPASFLWHSDLLSTYAGECLTRNLGDRLCDSILKDVTPFFPEHSSAHISMNMWLKGSGITFHNDANYAFGATIYLNKKWNPDHGGIFIWEVSNRQYRGVCPEFNAMVLNDLGQNHQVTAISPYAKDARITIQIFGKN
jgi:hypothetical protein